MHHSPPDRITRRARAVALTAVTAAALLLAGVAAPAANAAELSDVIQDVTVTPTNPRLGTQVETNIDWCVPDGTQAGDTFTLTLSEYLRALPPGFSLTDGDDGPVVATAAISTTDPAVVTFTMTDYAQTHSNVCGSAFIRSGFDNGLTPGETVPFTSEDNDGNTWSTDITPEGGDGPPEGDTDEAFKFGRLSPDQGHTDPNDAVQWYVVSPVGPLDRVTLSDTPGGGMNVDCASVDLLQGDRTETNIAEPYTRPTRIGALTCSADSVSVTLGPIPAGKAVRLGFKVDLDEATGPDAHTFTNTANVVSTSPDGSVRTDNPTRSITSSTGGGGGEGDNDPSVDIEKYATEDGLTAGDFDEDPGKRVEVGTPIPVTMTITNDGEEPLVDVVVSDTTDEGPAMTGLTCDFSALGGPASGTTWDGPFAVGDAFECTGTVPAMEAATLHANTADVAGTGQGSGTGVTDEDPFFSVTPPIPSIDIEKWSTADGYPGGDFDDLPGKAVAAGAPVPVTMTITNDGEEDLIDVSVRDTTDAGPDLTDLSCDFSPLGGPESGTDWEGPFLVGDSFDCTGTVPGMPVGGVHSDTADVIGTGVETGRDVDDEDPFHVTTPSPEPEIGIVKGDTEGNTADTLGDAVTLPGGATDLAFTVTNPGNEALADVVVSDRVVEGGTVRDLTCTFPDGSTGTTWDGPFEPADSFDCTATLSGVAAGSAHHDVASVTGTGVVSGITVTDDDPYFAQRPAASALAITGTDGAAALGGLAGGLLLVGAAVYLVGRRRSIRG
ncbi:hypothetical protein ELQ92_11135 [Labedella populi]|uniref:SDR-like Ig domain-containing protein n=1 Tax=Labedella populi TaxID=2498850 RepID=A0A3S3ZPB8_9MICO|nr:Ig-like domain-containing protein [Labedella populi]RWZ61523.1 hypothetical protein ELQ92_11135 [Labedella populi]